MSAYLIGAVVGGLAAALLIGGFGVGSCVVAEIASGLVDALKRRRAARRAHVHAPEARRYVEARARYYAA